MPGLWKVYFFGMMAVCCSSTTYSQEFRELKLGERSEIWMEGQTTVSNYRCTIDSFRLNVDARIQHNRRDKDLLEIHVNQLHCIFYVGTIHCGNKLMNRDVRNALNYGEHQRIVYRYKGIDSAGTIENIYSWNTFEVMGTLEINGIMNPVFFPVKARHLSDHKFSLKGQHTIDMLRYNVDPPSRLNGLLRARRNLTFHFDIVVGMQKE